jgi:alkylation response protein AidB-like acyl-CoA dehydrogenase
MNGTVEGEDVFIPMSCILGGQERIGFGWNMLMDALAEGESSHAIISTLHPIIATRK